METDQIKPASTSSNSPSIQEPLPDSTDTTHPIVTSNKHGMQTRSKSGIYKPKVLTVTKEPSTIQEALQHEYWQAAMRDELLALQRNGTWSLTSLPSGRKAIGCIQNQRKF